MRALLSALGLSFAIGILVVAWFTGDAIDLMFTRVMGEAQRQDVTVTFTHTLTDAAATELRALPGVRRVEPFRAVPATLRSGHLRYRTPLLGDIACHAGTGPGGRQELVELGHGPSLP